MIDIHHASLVDGAYTLDFTSRVTQSVSLAFANVRRLQDAGPQGVTLDNIQLVNAASLSAPVPTVPLPATGLLLLGGLAGVGMMRRSR